MKNKANEPMTIFCVLCSPRHICLLLLFLSIAVDRDRFLIDHNMIIKPAAAVSKGKDITPGAKAQSDVLSFFYRFLKPSSFVFEGYTTT